VKNINSGLNRCLEEGRHVLTLNDFAALSQCKAIIGNMEKLETESVEHRQHMQLIDSIPFCIAIETLLKTINTLGTIGVPRESLYHYKHITLKSTLFYSRTIICSAEM